MAAVYGHSYGLAPQYASPMANVGLHPSPRRMQTPSYAPASGTQPSPCRMTSSPRISSSPVPQRAAVVCATKLSARGRQAQGSPAPRVAASPRMEHPGSHTFGSFVPPMPGTSGPAGLRGPRRSDGSESIRPLQAKAVSGGAPPPRVHEGSSSSGRLSQASTGMPPRMYSQPTGSASESRSARTSLVVNCENSRQFGDENVAPQHSNSLTRLGFGKENVPSCRQTDKVIEREEPVRPMKSDPSSRSAFAEISNTDLQQGQRSSFSSRSKPDLKAKLDWANQQLAQLQRSWPSSEDSHTGKENYSQVSDHKMDHPSAPAKHGSVRLDAVWSEDAMQPLTHPDAFCKQTESRPSSPKKVDSAEEQNAEIHKRSMQLPATPKVQTVAEAPTVPQHGFADLYLRSSSGGKQNGLAAPSPDLAVNASIDVHDRLDIRHQTAGKQLKDCRGGAVPTAGIPTSQSEQKSDIPAADSAPAKKANSPRSHVESPKIQVDADRKVDTQAADLAHVMKSESPAVRVESLGAKADLERKSDNQAVDVAPVARPESPAVRDGCSELHVATECEVLAAKCDAEISSRRKSEDADSINSNEKSEEALAGPEKPATGSHAPKRPGRPPGKAPPMPPPRGRLSSSASSSRSNLQLKFKQGYSKQEHATVFDRQTEHGVNVAQVKLMVDKRNACRQASPTSSTTSLHGEKASQGLFAQRRALTLEITLRRCPISTSELAAVLKSLDFAHERLDSDALQRLMGKMPSPEEAEKVLLNESAAESLGSLETSLVPLCKVSDVERRLRIVACALSHGSQFSALKSQLLSMHAAAVEAMECQRLEKVLTCTLQLANAVNHGDDQVNFAVNFPLSSFSTVANWSLGPPAKLLHYVCGTLCSKEPDPVQWMQNFVAALASDLDTAAKVARACTLNLFEDVQSFYRDTAEVRNHLSSETDAVAKERCRDLLRRLEKEESELKKAEEMAKASARQVQSYFGERQQMKFETFLKHIVDVVDSLRKASSEFHKFIDSSWHCAEDSPHQEVATASRDPSPQPAAPSSQPPSRSVSSRPSTIMSCSTVLSSSTISDPSGDVNRGDYTVLESETTACLSARDLTNDSSAAAERVRRSSAGHEQRTARRSLCDDDTSRVSWLADGQTVRVAVDRYEDYYQVGSETT